MPHCAKADIYVDIGDEKKKYCIPKGTVIGYAIESMHKHTDKENWMNSTNEMCLENWLNGESNKFEMNESFLTFGTGRRDCVGRTLAIKELYIVMAYLFLNYRFTFKNKDDINKAIKTFFNGVNQIDPPIPVKVTRL